MTEEKKHREFWMAKSQIKFYQDETEPKIYPDAYVKCGPIEDIIEELKAELATVIKIGVEGQREINRKLTVEIAQLKSKQSQYESTMLEIIRVRDEYKDECERLQNKYDFQLLVKDRERLKTENEAMNQANWKMNSRLEKADEEITQLKKQSFFDKQENEYFRNEITQLKSDLKIAVEALNYIKDGKIYPMSVVNEALSKIETKV